MADEIKVYPIADYVPRSELKKMGVKSQLDLAAIKTGEIREVKKGELYLSGFDDVAKYADFDMPNDRIICKLVRRKKSDDSRSDNQ